MTRLKKTNIAAKVFKSACYYATLDHQKWWSNGHFAIKEYLLSKRTIHAINKYNPRDYQHQLENLYESLKTSEYDTLFLRNRLAKHHNLCVNLYEKYEKDGNTSYVAVQSQYMPMTYQYLWQKKNDYTIIHRDDDDNINLIIMPYRFDNKELDILKHNIHNQPKNRFIALLEE